MAYIGIYYGNYSNSSCPQTLVGLLKFNSEDFAFTEPIANTNV